MSFFELQPYGVTLYIAGAGSLPYGAIVDVMDAAKGAGVQRVGVITDGMRKAAAR